MKKLHTEIFTNELNIDFKPDMTRIHSSKKLQIKIQLKENIYKLSEIELTLKCLKNDKLLFLQISSLEFSVQKRHIKI